jgi:uncharacterized protein (TIGR03000 family)
MYSIVLLAAMGTGPGTPAADQPAAVVVAPPMVVAGGCTGCTGCTGYVSSCSGSCHGRGGMIFGHKHSCHGCCGGYASSYGCCGGYAAGHGCCGGRGGFLGHKHGHGCCGGYGYSAGCSGSCSGYGCLGGVYGSYVYPSYAVPVTTGANPYYYPGTIRPSTPLVIPQAQPEVKPQPKSGANLKFNLPAGATLFVDGQKTSGEGTERTFYTPPLEAGQKFFYDVRAEIAVGGKTIVEEKRVIVEAGAEITESFPKVIAAAAAATTVAGK